MRRALFSRAIPMLLAMAGLAAGQIPFQIRVLQPDSVSAIANGGTVSFNAEIGQSQTARFIVNYRGTGTISFSRPDLLGSSAFTLTSFVTDLAGGASFDVRFAPTSANPVNALFTLFYTETTGAGTTLITSTNSISITFQGGAPSMALSYLLPADQNVIPLPPGSSVVFPATLINTITSAVFSITNRGSGQGTVKGVTISGAAFKISGLPLFPISLNAGQELRFNLQYLPPAVQLDSGSIQVTLGDRVVTVGLEGSGASSSFKYELLTGSTVTALTPNGSASLPDTVVGDSNSVVVRVRNIGNASGQISSVLLLGAGFQIVDLPVLPQTLAPNATLLFTVTFTPAQAGPSNARLRIGEDTFDLTANGLGTRLVFSYISGGATIAVAPGGPVIFSPVAIGQTSRLDFTIRNAGTQTAPLASVGIVEQRSPFSLSGLPALPANLAPNAEFRFSISFAPVAAGFSNGTLRIDTATIILSGSNVTLVPLPAYRFESPGEGVDPLTQPAFGLTLSAPYSLNLTGVLTMTVAAEAGGDPAVQFSTGGRTVNFVIPANTTRAVFPNQSTQIRLQTGSVAGTITITPSFATQAGGADLTPDPPVVQRFTVQSLAPRLQTVRIDNRTSTGFTLSITGFSTSRTLTDVILAFTAAPGFNLANAQITYPLGGGSTSWFLSPASQAFGGQFTVSIPFALQSNNGSSTPIDALQSVSVTATNERGTSNALQINLR